MTPTREDQSAPVSKNSPEAQSVRARAIRFWPEIAAALSFPPEDVQFFPLRSNSRNFHKLCVLDVRVPKHGRFVLRGDFGDKPVERRQAVLARHKKAQVRLNDTPGVFVPEILWHSADYSCILMEFVAGETVDRELGFADLGLGSRPEILQQVGQATAALHGVLRHEERLFWPKFYLPRVVRWAGEVRSGELDVFNRHKFLGLCAYLHRMARRAKGRPFIAGDKHGDFHFHNVMASKEGIHFIDFSDDGGSVQLDDIANLWMANLLQGELDDPLVTDGYGGVSDTDWRAFEYGYGADVLADPVFHFVYGMHLLKFWRFNSLNSLAAEKSMRRRKVILHIFDRLLAEEIKDQT